MTSTPRVGWRSREAAGLALALAAALVVAGCAREPGSASAGPSASHAAAARAPAPAPAPAPARNVSVDPDEERRQAVAGLVAQRAAALAARDRAAWLATVSDPGSPFGQRQGAVFDRMVQLPVSGFGQQGVDIASPLAADRAAAVGPEAWVATVHQSYQLTGYDRAPHRYDASFTVVRTPGGWRFAGDGDGSTQRQPWDLPGMTTVRSATTLVIGNLPVERLRQYLALGDAAQGRVAAVWGGALPAVLVAPAHLEELTAQLQRASSSGLDQVAAITDGPLTAGRAAVSDRVYLNPQAFARLTVDGRRVVVTHELTHVTVRGTTLRPVPIWLSEGFADYVGFSGLGLSVDILSADLLARVRAGTGPTRLPTEGDFDPARGVIAPTYSAAWLAVSRMAARHGQAKAVAFYRAVAGKLAVDPAVAGDPAAVTRTAFEAVLGTSEEAFVADWLAYLAELAH